MPNALRKISTFLGLTDENYVYEDETVAEVEPTPIRERRSPRTSRVERAERRESRPEVHLVEEVAAVVAPAPVARNITLKPDSFNDARVIGEEFRDGATVVVNLQSLDEATKRRIVDFMSGLALGLDGKMTKIAMSVFMLAPAQVELRDEAGIIVENDGFFNNG
jgi:cell division inhibitor SepF